MPIKNIRPCIVLLFSFVFVSCSVQKKISRAAIKSIIENEALKTAHAGISIFEPATGKWWYNYQGDHYFVPASNVKIPTCYAAMKYLGDSLIGARVVVADDSALEIYPSGDPTFLHPDFKNQPLYKTMKQYKTIRWNLTDWKATPWGNGWSWDDYDASYMAERAPFPVYGNLLRVSFSGDTLKTIPAAIPVWTLSGSNAIRYNSETHTVASKRLTIERAFDQNRIYLKPSPDTFSLVSIPFKTDIRFISEILKDTLKAENVSTFSVSPDYIDNSYKTVIHSQPTDSVLLPMMHNSDNFLAEQCLLMVSNEVAGVMNDSKIIDTILKTDFADLPQKPRWVDGSGLSRYNLFTPQDFIFILAKMQTGFGMERLKRIFPAGGKGTLKGYYAGDSTSFFVKTGTLSGVVALSGFFYTRKNKLLLFSVLINNHRTSATAVRRTVEGFLQGIRRQY